MFLFTSLHCQPCLVPASLGAMPEYLVEGYRVTCTQDDRQQRVWHSDCDEFKRRLVTRSEGSCPHVALAIQGALESGAITPPL